MKHIQGEENIVASSVETAIKRELKRKDQVVKAHLNNALDTSLEACIAGVLLHLDRLAVPMTQGTVGLGEEVIPEERKTLTLTWVRDFKMRWSQWLTKRDTGATEPERVEGQPPEVMDAETMEQLAADAFSTYVPTSVKQARMLAELRKAYTLRSSLKSPTKKGNATRRRSRWLRLKRPRRQLRERRHQKPRRP